MAMTTVLKWVIVMDHEVARSGRTLSARMAQGFREIAHSEDAVEASSSFEAIETSSACCIHRRVELDDHFASKGFGCIVLTLRPSCRPRALLAAHFDTFGVSLKHLTADRPSRRSRKAEFVPPEHERLSSWHRDSDINPGRFSRKSDDDVGGLRHT
jgi:hypothetical protein